MANRLAVIGTFDQPVASLPDVDLMRCLAAMKLAPAIIVFKRSDPAHNPPVPQQGRHGGWVSLHVADFNAPGTVAAIRALAPDLMLYAGGRDLLRQPLLDSAGLGCLGGHYGRLPGIRGMATVEWSLIENEAPTVAIQRISPGIDTGDVIMQARVPLMTGDTFTSIRDRSYFLTKVMLALSAARLFEGAAATPQSLAGGRQYFRMHPALYERARRALSLRLART